MQDQFIPNSEDQLEDALALLAAGIPLAEILAGAGEDAVWLRPFLEMAAEVKELGPAIKVPAPEASLQRMLAYGQKLAADSPAPAAQSNLSILLDNLLRGAWLPRLATGLVSVLLLVVLLGGTLTVLAQRSLPGQSLYGLKRAGETLRLTLTTDPAQRAQLIKNYNEHRQTEAKLLLEQNQVAAVVFLGTIEKITGSSLTLDGLVVQLTPQTKVTGSLAAGARVEAELLTQPPDQLLALAVTVVEPAPPVPTPLPSPTVTPSPSPSPSPTATAMPTATATATRSLSSSADTLQLPTFTPTSVPTEVPTHTPTVPPPPPPTATSLPPTVPPPTSPLIPPTVVDDGGNANENNNDGAVNNDNPNSNDNADDHGNDSGHNDSGGSNSGSGGGDNSGSGSDHSGSDNSGGSDDHSGGDDK